MSRQQSGFTLIELIAVFVILGILAATAIPKYIDLSDEAQEAATRSVAGSIESASALNHAIDIAVEAGLSNDIFTSIDTCANAGDLLTGGLPKSKDGTVLYLLDSKVVGNKATITCTLTNKNNATDTTSFTLIGACENDTNGVGAPCA